MKINLYPTPEQEIAEALGKAKKDWARLLELIFEDSTLEEILSFASRLSQLPQYSEREEFARDFLRQEGTHIRKYEYHAGGMDSHWEEHTEELVTLLKLPENLIKKGSKLWKIEI